MDRSSREYDIILVDMDFCGSKLDRGRLSMTIAAFAGEFGVSYYDKNGTHV